MLPQGFKEAEKETQVLIPQPFMGTIIGTGGTKINELRMVRKAVLQVYSNKQCMARLAYSDLILVYKPITS